jgi:hypothetical protein
MEDDDLDLLLALQPDDAGDESEGYDIGLPDAKPNARPASMKRGESGFTSLHSF